MSQTAVQVALPQIMTVYGLNLEQAQWIVTAYVIAGRRLVVGGRLARQLAGQPHVLPAGSCPPSWSTRPCAPSPGVARHLLPSGCSRASANSPIPPMTMKMFMSNVFPPAQRGMAMGLFGMGRDRWSHCRYCHWGLYHGVPRLAHGLLPELCPWGEYVSCWCCLSCLMCVGGTARARPGRLTQHGYLPRQPPCSLESGATGGLGYAVYPAAVCWWLAWRL